MKIAVEGCAHGELEKIYDTLQGIEKSENIKVDLLLCCGDFQSTRNLEDLQTMAVPQKYQDMCTFYKYYSGELVAPLLTIFIGGNHEASNYLQELPYGGWVAPNIYYLGYAGVVCVNGIRIAGLSGIYKGHDFLRGRHEFPPYTDSTCRSVYHVRQLEVFRLKQLSGQVDIFMSHDWPRGIYNYGNKAQLVRFKPHFRDEVDNNQLGSRPCEELLKTLKPALWFAAHLHCKFAALVPHEETDENAPQQQADAQEAMDENASVRSISPAEERVTKFLALDKCLPKRRFLQVLDYASAEHTDDGELRFEYDLEWLSILYLTNHLVNVKNSNYYLPGPRGGSSTERYDFTPSPEELQYARQKFGGDLRIPENFCRTVEPYNPSEASANVHPPQPKALINPQAMQFCDTLGIDDPLSLAMLISGHELSHSSTLDSSDTQLSDSSCLVLGDQSDLNTSSILDVSTEQISPLKRKIHLGLNLPKPVATEDPHDTTANPDELQCSDNSEDEIEAVEAVEANVTDDAAAKLEIEVMEEPVECSSETSKSKPPIKKFKRRNQEIYKENSDGDDVS